MRETESHHFNSKLWHTFYGMSILVSVTFLVLSFLMVVSPTKLDEWTSDVNNFLFQRKANQMGSQQSVKTIDIKLSNLDPIKPNHVNQSRKVENKISYFNVKSRFANVRMGPGIRFEVKKILLRNQSVKVLETRGRWYRIDKDSWVSKVNLSPKKSR